jgi:hypothetical protein
MAKPILIVRVPHHTPHETVNAIKETIHKSIPDWHLLMVVNDVTDVQFESHTVDKATDIDIEKLTEICNACLS